jgi:hypothetical protein
MNTHKHTHTHTHTHAHTHTVTGQRTPGPRMNTGASRPDHAAFLFVFLFIPNFCVYFHSKYFPCFSEDYIFILDVQIHKQPTNNEGEDTEIWVQTQV